MILISAGHHPTKPGACFESFCEHDEALKWVDEICKNLKTDYVKVPPSTLRHKVAFINERHPKLAVEVHFNSAKRWEDLNKNGVIDDGEMVNVGKGSMSLYFPGSIQGKKLATKLHEPMKQTFGQSWNGVMEGWYMMNKKNGPDYFLAATKCPAVILEPEFIHRKGLIQKSRWRVCIGIAAALDAYVK